MSATIHTHFSDLRRRWEKARKAAFSCAVPDSESNLKTEEELFENLDDVSRQNVLKNVFKNSLKLGSGFSSFLNVTLELEDFQTLFGEIGNTVPCFRRQKLHEDDGIVFERKPCNSKLCDFYREAIDGLVLGLSEEVMFSRHRSAEHGDQFCRDALFSTRESPLRFGLLPNEFKAALKPVYEKFSRLKLVLEVFGMSEGIIFYTLSREGEPLCGASSDMFHTLFKTEIAKISERYKVKDVSPAAVFVERA